VEGKLGMPFSPRRWCRNMPILESDGAPPRAVVERVLPSVRLWNILPRVTRGMSPAQWETCTGEARSGRVLSGNPAENCGGGYVSEN